MESKNSYPTLIVAFAGYVTKEIDLTKLVNYEMKIILNTEEVLDEVKVFAGKTSKKNNPALDILRKIWER